MTKDGIARLLETIAIHYQAFEKRVLTPEGEIRASFVDEWYERIGYLGFDDAMKMLTEYLRHEDNKYAPTVSYFMSQKRSPSVRVETGLQHIYHVGHVGELLDEAESEYGDPDNLDQKYVYMGAGIIQTKDGRIVQGSPTHKPEFIHCCGNCERHRYVPRIGWQCNGRDTAFDDTCFNWQLRHYLEVKHEG